MEARSWADYKVAKRIEISLNPIRNWVETVMPSIEQEYKKLKEEQNLTRPEKPIVFLLGDPTKFKRFKTPIEYRQHLASCVGKIDKYTPFFGDLDVRKQLANKLSTPKWPLTENEVILTCGGSGALYQCIQALAQKGDKIMMPKPTFPLMQAFADFLEVKVVSYHLSFGDWQPDPEEVDKLLTENPEVNLIRFILINSPSNPQGSIFNEDKVKALIKVCEKHNNLPIVSDEIYEDMLFKDQKWQFLSEYSDNVPVFRCSGLTKKCQVPGWRIGWLAMIGKPGVFDQVKQALKQWTNIILMPNTICQAGLNEIYEMSNKTIDKIMEELELRANTFRKGMEGAPGVVVGQTNGAMYSTLIIKPNEFKDIKSSIDFTKKLQIEENVLVFPGELFQHELFVRLVICVDVDLINEACSRIKRFCEKHKA